MFRRITLGRRRVFFSYEAAIATRASKNKNCKNLAFQASRVVAVRASASRLTVAPVLRVADIVLIPGSIFAGIEARLVNKLSCVGIIRKEGASYGSLRDTVATLTLSLQFISITWLFANKIFVSNSLHQRLTYSMDF